MVSNKKPSATLPGNTGVAESRVLAQLAARAARGATLEDLATIPGLAEESRDLETALESLQKQGLAVEWAGRWYAVRLTEWLVGTIELLDGGDALVRTGERREASYWIGQRQLKHAVDRDLVLIKRLKGRGVERGVARTASRGSARGEQLPEAAVVKVLSSRYQHAVGTVELRDGRAFLVPYDSKLTLEIEVLEAGELGADDWIVVALQPADPRIKGRRANIVERLGALEQPGTDVRVVLRHYEIPEPFPPAVEESAVGLPADPAPEHWAGRLDLRAATVVTIDGETARDFDDALSIDRLPGGGWRLGVHIADVAHYVQEGSALDLEAYRRGTSVYYPERAVPMLPEGISNGLCSLRPQVPRLAMTAMLELDAAGEVVTRTFAESVIRSTRRLTYTEVRRLLDEPTAADAAEYGDVLVRLKVMRELMQVLLRRRNERGSIDFDLPEGDVILDTDGNTVGIRASERNVAHRIVEEFMIAANEAVAFTLETSDCPALYRVHDSPLPLRLEELREVLRSLGHDLPGELETLHPSAFQKVLREVAGRPEEGFITALVLRSVQRAVYTPECRGHYALAARYYTHFTSPIRRYPDLVVHRRLKALLRGTAEKDAERSLLIERLPVIGEHCSDTERRAEQSERDLLQWKKVRFLAARVGETFPGRVTGVQAFGLFVQLDDWYVDGLVPIRTLADDFYIHQAENHALVGQENGQTFQLAQQVRVVLAGVDTRRRGLQLKIEGMPEPRRSRPEAGGLGAGEARGPRNRAGAPPSTKRKTRYDRKR
ncbi:MAG: ribonuclease R [Acidobacteriota bacterium]